MSAVVPVYNERPFLAQAIRSVLDQTYPRLECIVVDDGSTDGSADVAASFGSRVRVIRQANGGVASARNAGVAASGGELVAFLDADDWWLPGKLERQVRCWQGRPWAGMVYTGFTMVRGTRHHGRSAYRMLATEPTGRIKAATMLQGYGIGFGFSALVSRRALDSVGPFETRLSVSADIEFAWRLLQQFEVLAIPEPLAVYRLHGRGQMHKDLLALEHDRRIVTETCFAEGTPERRRATANLHTHLAYRWLMRGDVRRALTHGRAVMATEPTRLLTLPAEATARRAVRRLLHRWPARPQRERLGSSPTDVTAAPYARRERFEPPTA